MLKECYEVSLVPNYGSVPKSTFSLLMLSVKSASEIASRCLKIRGWCLRRRCGVVGSVRWSGGPAASASASTDARDVMAV